MEADTLLTMDMTQNDAHADDVNNQTVNCVYGQVSQMVGWQHTQHCPNHTGAHETLGSQSAHAC